MMDGEQEPLLARAIVLFQSLRNRRLVSAGWDPRFAIAWGANSYGVRSVVLLPVFPPAGAPGALGKAKEKAYASKNRSLAKNYVTAESHSIP